MRRWWLLAGLVVASALAAPPAQAQAPDLRAALLTLDDLPTGWTAAAVGPPAATTPAFCTGEPMEQLAWAAEATFQKRDAGPALELSIATLVQRLAVLELPDATDFMDRLAGLPVPCDWDETARSGDTGHLALQRLSFPRVGDRSDALRLRL